MQKTKLILLNLVCIFLLYQLAILSCHYVTIGAQYFRSDYKTFYRSLHDKTNVYNKNYYAFFKKNEKNQWTRVSPVSAATNINTPTMNFILKGLVNFSPILPINTKYWIVINMACTALALFVMMRWVSNSVEPFYYFYPLLLVFYCSWYSLYNVSLGQVAALLMPLFCLVFVLDEKKHKIPMAILLALLTTLKLFFALFGLLFLLRRQWRIVFLYAAACLFFLFLPLAYFSLRDYHSFFNIMDNHFFFMTRSVFPMNGSILGFITHWVLLLKIYPSDLQMEVATTLLSLFVFVRYLLYDHRFLRHLPDFVNPLRYSFLIVIAMLCSPLGWLYYFLYFIVPVFVCYKIVMHYQLSKAFFIFLFLAMSVFLFGWAHESHGLLSKIQFFSVFLSLLCWAAALRYAALGVFENKPAMCVQRKIYIGIFVATSLLGVVLMSFNYGIPNFFDGKQEAMMKSLPRGMWLHAPEHHEVH